ncbi:MAG: cyclic nucleotide-binding domain-containing protein [Gemmatimonadota bacterium]
MPRSVLSPSIAERAARLRYTPLFGSLPAREIRKLARECGTVEVRAGETVVKQGDEGDTLYLVVRGVLRVERVDAGGSADVLGEIHKGEYFGEFALLDAVRRTASVAARSSALLMTLTRRAFESVAEGYPDLRAAVREQIEHRRDQHVDYVRPDVGAVRGRLSALLEVVSDDLLEELDEQVEWQRVTAGTEVIRQGEPGAFMYLVSEGHLVAFSSEEPGVEVRIGDIGVGEPIGEASLLSGKPRDATVRAMSDCELLCLSAEGLQTLIHRHPELEQRFLRMMERRRSVREELMAAARGARSSTFPTAAEVESVILEADPVACNYGITRLYYRIGMGLARMLGDENVNWPLFGARASYTAGAAIRKEVLTPPNVGVGIPPLRLVIRMVERHFRDSSLTRRLESTLDTVSTAMAAGNLRIFAEIGSVVGRFLRTFGEDAAYDQVKLDAFLETLVPGPVELGGQDLLGQGLTSWYRACFEDDPDRKAERILLGNCLMGLHEQTRVQPDIAEALEAPLRLTVGDEFGRWMSGSFIVRHLPGRSWLRGVADRIEYAFLRGVARLLRGGITRYFMRFQLPDGDLRLGRSVRRSLTTPLSRELATIELLELRSFLERHGGFRDGGATDWSSLGDRMRYIIVLFRRAQTDRRLFAPPFENMD